MATPGESSKAAFSARRRNQEVRRRRYEPVPVYVLAEHLKREGVELHKFRGPWHPIRRPLRRPGRNEIGRAHV